MGKNSLREAFLAVFELGLHLPVLVFLVLFLPFIGQPPAPRAAGFLFSLSFAMLFAFVYLLNKTTDMTEDSVNQPLNPGLRNAAPLIRTAAWTCLIVPIAWLAARRLWAALGVYLVVAFFGYAYSQGISLGSRPRRLKNIFLVKNFTTAGLGWAPALVYAPMAFENRLAPGHLMSYVRITMLIFAISACCDIRDMKGDFLAGVRTLPNVIGVPATKLLCLLLLAAYAALAWRENFPPPLQAALIATALWIVLADERRKRFYFHWGFLFWILALSLIALEAFL